MSITTQESLKSKEHFDTKLSKNGISEIENKNKLVRQNSNPYSKAKMINDKPEQKAKLERNWFEKQNK